MVENRITVSYDANLTGPRSVIDSVQEAGGDSKSYRAIFYVPPRGREAERRREIRAYRNQFLLSCLFSVPVFVFSMVLPMIHHSRFIHRHVLAFLLRAPPSRTKQKLDIASILRKSWYHLRLSVRHPSRVPTWDAIVLTAASPEQAQLYEWQLNRAKRIGRIAASTVTIAVPDPDGQRIGSGAATLNAIHALAKLYQKLDLDPESEVVIENGFKDQNSDSAMVSFLAKRHILLLHAGGDSKRVPWANPMGKVFLPLPYLAGDDPDGPVPLLFDHILAVASCARQAFENEELFLHPVTETKLVVDTSRGETLRINFDMVAS